MGYKFIGKEYMKLLKGKPTTPSAKTPLTPPSKANEPPVSNEMMLNLLVRIDEKLTEQAERDRKLEEKILKIEEMYQNIETSLLKEKEKDMDIETPATTSFKGKVATEIPSSSAEMIATKEFKPHTSDLEVGIEKESADINPFKVFTPALENEKQGDKIANEVEVEVDVEKDINTEIEQEKKSEAKQEKVTEAEQEENEAKA